MVCWSKPTVYAYVPNFVLSVYSVANWWWKPPNFATFELQHLVVLPIGSVWRKLKINTQPKTFTYQNLFCSQMASWQDHAQKFHQVWRHKLDEKQKTAFLVTPVAGDIQTSPKTWHGDRGPRSHSCISKMFGGQIYSFAAMRHWKYGGNLPPSA